MSPLFDPLLSEHPRIIRLGWEIPHDIVAGASLVVGTLKVVKLAARVARKLSF